MWEIKFQEKSRDPQGQFHGHNKGQKFDAPKHSPIGTRITYLESLSNCLSINASFMTIRSLFPVRKFLIYEGSKVGNRARFCRNSQSLGGHISHTTGPIGQRIGFCAVGSHTTYIYQVSLQSETVGFKFLLQYIG